MQDDEEIRRSLEVVASRWMSFWQGNSLADFDEVHAPAFVDHSAAARPPDRSGFRQSVVELYLAFPDFEATIDFMAIDVRRGLVTVRWTAAGHMKGSFMGLAPTDEMVAFTGIEVIRVSGGQVIERWGEWDEGSIVAQISGR